MTARVGPGVINLDLSKHTAALGVHYAPDPSSQSICTIGGNIATNAGGNRVIRYGMMRELVLGLEVVLADGTVVSSMNRMIKNNAGYDLKQWFIGSEGTLGIVTRAVLRLREAPASRETLLVAAESFDAVTGLLKHVDQRLGGTLSAFEVMWNDFYVAVTTPPAKAAPPLPQHHPYYVLIEAMGGDAMADRARLEAAMSEAMAEGLIRDAVLAESESQARRLWAIRDDVEQLFRFAPLVIFDVSLPVSNMPAYLEEVRARYAAGFPDGALFVFGHLGDGNLHLVAAPGCEAREQVERIVYEPLVAVAGSISAEHGIGLEKRPYLQLCRSPAEIALMRRIKAALDPKGILNPGRILEPV